MVRYDSLRLFRLSLFQLNVLTLFRLVLFRLIMLTSETPPSDWPKLIRDSGITSTTGSIDVIDSITPDNLHFMVGRPVRPGLIDISVDDLSTMHATVCAAVRYAQRMNPQLHLPVVVSGSSASSSSSLRPADINLILDAYRRGYVLQHGGLFLSQHEGLFYLMHSRHVF